MAEQEEAPWYDAYPKPRNQSPGTVSREDLLHRLQQEQGEKLGSKDFLLIDLRRVDHVGGTIKGSINLPAQSVYHSLPTVLELCKNAGIVSVIWYCGSSRGRGPRAAGWFNDLLRERKISGMESVILLGGIKGWVRAGDEYTAHMDGYDALAWEEENLMRTN